MDASVVSPFCGFHHVITGCTWGGDSLWRQMWVVVLIFFLTLIEPWLMISLVDAFTGFGVMWTVNTELIKQEILLYCVTTQDRWRWTTVVRFGTTLWGNKTLRVCLKLGSESFMACGCHSQVEAQTSKHNRRYWILLSLWCVSVNPWGLEH